MKKFLIKGLILIIILALPQQGVSMSYFSDTETVSGNTFTTGYWAVKINEVYYDVDGGHGSEGTNEWVEIYNPTSSSVDISGWTIKNAGSSDTIPSSSPIPADGYAVITPNSSTWTHWSIPVGAVKIVLGSDIGNGLGDDGDRVVLELSSGVEIDAVSWGSDTYAFSPSVVDVAEGHSISRVTKGVDTDSASDWMDTYGGSSPAGPNPGTNPHPSETFSEPELEVDEEMETIDVVGDGIEGSVEQGQEEELVETEEAVIEDEEAAEDGPVAEEVTEETETETEELSGEEETVEPVDEDASEPQEPADSLEAEGQGEEGQTQADETDEQDAVIKQTQDETQGVSGDEPASDPEPEDSQPQPEDLGQPSGNDEIPTE